jgi:hypothetical protein
MLRLASLTDHMLLERFLTEEEDREVRRALRSLRIFLDQYFPYAALLQNYTLFEDDVCARFIPQTSTKVVV